MALILLSNCFKDADSLTDGSNNLFQSELIKDLGSFVLLMLLIWAFHYLDAKRADYKVQLSVRFIRLKD